MGAAAVARRPSPRSQQLGIRSDQSYTGRIVDYLKRAAGERERRKERLGLTFIHGEGTFCHPRMQMAKMPTEEDGVRSLRGAEMGGNDFGSL